MFDVEALVRPGMAYDGRLREPLPQVIKEARASVGSAKSKGLTRSFTEFARSSTEEEICARAQRIKFFSVKLRANSVSDCAAPVHPIALGVKAGDIVKVMSTAEYEMRGFNLGQAQEAILDDCPRPEPDDIRACLAHAHAIVADEPWSIVAPVAMRQDPPTTPAATSLDQSAAGQAAPCRPTRNARRRRRCAAPRHAHPGSAAPTGWQCR
jgi:hypothetical protein